MKLDVNIVGSAAEILRHEFLAGERAVTQAVNEAGITLKGRWRQQVVSSGLGARLGKTIRNQTFPKNDISMNAAALVFSKAPKIIGAFDEGVRIKSQAGSFLAIPTDAAPKKRGGGRLTPGEFERRTGQKLQFIFRKRGNSLLVAEGRLSKGKKSSGKFRQSRSKTGRGLTSVPIFTLVPQVTLKKRLDLQSDADKVGNSIPGDIVDKWVVNR